MIQVEVMKKRCGRQKNTLIEVYLLSKEVTKSMDSDRIEWRENTCGWLNRWESIIEPKNFWG